MMESNPVCDAPPTEGVAALTRSHAIQVGAALRPYVRAMLGIEFSAAGPLPLSVVPHGSLMLTVQLGRAADCIEQKGVHGENTTLTGIRQHTGEFVGAGDCVTLFALLTPLGAVQLLDSQPLAPLPRIRARVAELLDRQVTRRLESDVALAATLHDKLWALAAWLEDRATAQRHLARAGLRAGRAAMRLSAEPGIGIEALADEQHVSRRQLERDFLLRKGGGSVFFDGEDITHASASRIARLGLALVPQWRELFATFSVEETLHTGAHAWGRRRAGALDHALDQTLDRALDRVYAMFPLLSQRRRQMASSLSGGEQQMLTLGRALMGRPRMMILDEPSAGLAVGIVQDVVATICRIRDEGVPILLVEQNLDIARQVAGRAVVLSAGRSTWSGTMAEATFSSAVRDAFFA